LGAQDFRRAADSNIENKNSHTNAECFLQTFDKANERTSLPNIKKNYELLKCKNGGCAGGKIFKIFV
jgi:hypothetical protein